MIQGIMKYYPYLQDDTEIMHSTRDVVEQCQQDTVQNVRHEVEILLSTYPSILSLVVCCVLLFAYDRTFESDCIHSCWFYIFTRFLWVLVLERFRTIVTTAVSI